MEAYNGFGWHEIIQAPVTNKQILALGFTPAGVIESEARLWYGQGTQAGYIIMPDKSDALYDYASAEYETAGEMEFSWFDAGMHGIEKDWFEIQLYAENIDATSGPTGESVEILYKIDEATSYTSLKVFLASDMANGYATVSFPTGTTGKRIRFRIDPDSSDGNETPLVRAVVLKYRLTPTRKYGFDLVLQISKRGPGGEQHSVEWETQLDNFITTFEKDEPVTLEYTQGKKTRTFTVALTDPFTEVPLIGKDGQEYGSVIRLQAWQV